MRSYPQHRPTRIEIYGLRINLLRLSCLPSFMRSLKNVPFQSAKRFIIFGVYNRILFAQSIADTWYGLTLDPCPSTSDS